MSKATSNWYVITGAPSSGKSTIIKALASEGYATFEETGKKIIDEELASGKSLDDIKVDSPEFEERWVKLQCAAEAKLDRNELTFFDRGIIDTLGYFNNYGWPLTPLIKELTDQAAYRQVFLLELLDYDKDYYRVESAATAKRLEAAFKKAYQDKGYQVIVISAAPVAERMNKILAFLN